MTGGVRLKTKLTVPFLLEVRRRGELWFWLNLLKDEECSPSVGLNVAASMPSRLPSPLDSRTRGVYLHSWHTLFICSHLRILAPQPPGIWTAQILNAARAWCGGRCSALFRVPRELNRSDVPHVAAFSAFADCGRVLFRFQTRCLCLETAPPISMAPTRRRGSRGDDVSPGADEASLRRDIARLTLKGAPTSKRC